MKEISSNIVWHLGQVSRRERQQLLGQESKTIWLTGLSGAGKSTLAFSLERRLINEGRICYALDGDNVRHGLNKNLGFTSADRSENIRRVAEVARLMNDAGVIVITAFISPYRADRQMAREIIGAECFHEIYVSTPLETCERRDPKGLYSRARSGVLKEFTGVSAPYEAPEAPELTINTDEFDIPSSVSLIIDTLVRPAKARQNA